MSDRTPTGAEVINRALDLYSAGLFVCRPGQIQKIDAQTLLCEVKPLLKELSEDAGGDSVVEPLPVVPGCVLFFPQGGDFVDTFPVQQGDSCWLIFADRSLDKWQAGNGDTDPVFQNRHDLSGAVVLVGGRPKAKAIQEFDTARRVIGKQGGPRAAFASDAIHLGVGHNESASEAVILGNKYSDDESQMFDQCSSSLQTAMIALQLAQTTMSTAAASNAVPMSGGAAASPSFIAVGVAIGQAATQLGNVATQLSQFASGKSTRLSTKVKVK